MKQMKKTILLLLTGLLLIHTQGNTSIAVQNCANTTANHEAYSTENFIELYNYGEYGNIHTTY